MILRWLLPLGFIGLVAIAVLLVIYLIRPQYKEKRISGTKIWKRVLSQSKKQHLILSNILIFFIQALVLAIIAVGFAEPRLYFKEVVAEDRECVLVIDASASMRAKRLTDGKTRFERALSLAKEEVDDFFKQSKEGGVSAIVTGKTSTYLFSDLKYENKSEIISLLDNISCTLEEGDIESAINLAGTRLDNNPYAKIYIYSDTQFGNLGTAVETENVCDKVNEQNIAILGCTVAIVDNEYMFEMVLGAYGDITRKCNVSFDIKGADNGKIIRDFHLEVPVTFSVDGNLSEQVQRVTVTATNATYGGEEDWFFDSYEEVKISIPNLNDSISDDDEYYVFEGLRDPIKIEYWSKNPNGFWQFGFNNLAVNMSDYRNITFHEIYHEEEREAENTGYDFYIFENSLPDEILKNGLPKDGIVILVDPDETLNQANLGLSLKESVALDGAKSCTSAIDHQLLRYMNYEKINLTQYSRIDYEGSGFEPILYLNEDPIMLVKNTSNSKYIMLPFSINMSNFYSDQFQIFLYNIINYFAPVTLQKNDYNFGEITQVNCKGNLIKVDHNENEKIISEFPNEFTFDDVGTYTFTTLFGLEKEDEVRRAYVHISPSESKLFAQSEFHANLDNNELQSESGKDFFIWLAAASLMLMIIEWFLQFKYIL